MFQCEILPCAETRDSRFDLDRAVPYHNPWEYQMRAPAGWDILTSYSHIVLLLHFKDSSCSACKTFWHVAQNFADIPCVLELYAQGFMETLTLDWVDISSKMHSFKKLASMWQSDFHLNSVLKKQQLEPGLTT
ncbi:hypothetical protein BDR06DRAFT_485445 [Suillus hirtellus]|nr:hypothetical protein BDR06DRAFT_485445 [Suillus hirtellus]